MSNKNHRFNLCNWSGLLIAFCTSTGARMIYNYLPKSAGLRRITLHKSQSNGDKQYVLMCECANLLQDFTSVAKLLPALKARLCGCTGVYRSIFIIWPENWNLENREKEPIPIVVIRKKRKENDLKPKLIWDLKNSYISGNFRDWNYNKI